MYCSECGKKLEKGSLFCDECGAKVEAEKEEDTEKKAVEKKVSKTKDSKKKETKKSESKKEVRTEKVDEKKDSNKKISEKKKKKKSKKKIFIILLFLVLIVVCSFFAWKYFDDNRSVGSTWGDSYYYFIRDSKDQKGDNPIPDGATIKFIQVPKLEEPVMVINYDKNRGEYSNIYYIKKGKVNEAISSEPSEIKFLYNIEKEEYNWYVHTENDNKEYYVPVKEVIESDGKSETSNSYVYEKDEQITVETIDGDKLTMDKFDSEFVDPDIEVDGVQYSDDLSNAQLQEVITDGVEQYNPNKDIVSDKVDKEVQEQVTETNEKLEEMDKAKEEASSVLKVGDYTLKYGTYQSEYYNTDGIGNCGRYTLKPDGTYTYFMPNSVQSTNSERITMDLEESGKYEVKTTYNGIGPNPTPVLSLCFSPTKTNIPTRFLEFSPSHEGESAECFQVKANNSWTGVQYPNLHTYIGS